MRRRLQVVLGNRQLPVGELLCEAVGRRQTSSFRYAAEWLAHPDSFALSPAMPLSEERFFHSSGRAGQRSALPGPLADSAPDSWGRSLIDKLLGRRASEFDYLLETADATRQGALRYLDEDGQALAQRTPPVPRLVDLQELSRLAGFHDRGEALTEPQLLAVVGSAGSLGGARPKANCVHDGKPCIAKFTSPRDTRPIERLEVATLNLARAAGLRAAQAQLAFAKSAQPIAVITRFDRRGGERIPYLSGQSFLGRERASGAFYTDLADQMRAHCAHCRVELEELHSRIMFTILVSNNDDHLKNHGFLYAGEGKWLLSPAFDINPQPERHRHLETGISELSGNQASIEAALEAAPLFDLPIDQAKANLHRIAATIAAEWQAQCQAAGMTQKQIAAAAPAFHHPEAQKAPRLAP